MSSPSKMWSPVKDHFYYFAYGSNLLKRRIRINNPTAEFMGIGKLNGHQLNFIKYSDHWRGSSATIIPTESSYVWGAIWRLHDKDMTSLDWQEGVKDNWYFPKTVDVITSDGNTVPCRTYQQTINPPLRKPNEDIPPERRPSITYLECILNGAKECNLPKDYVAELKKIPHNGQEASPKMIEKLQMQVKS
ncbi:gamma-glutamylcyclotransferase-like [Aricia agestis]|uniref:gamma-glutamylcyclotransferase-like n=1 Tax=Aricia agestis TaxID=91739 RepID=UPI001C2057F6|nr:gamma-glutamylcyclotransferase-like [Aricia agestis]